MMIQSKRDCQSKILREKCSLTERGGAADVILLDGRLFGWRGGATDGTLGGLSMPLP